MGSAMFRLSAVVVFLLAGCAAAFAQGGTITIQGQAGTFPTIQSAIDAVPPGGTVIVDGGNHAENLLISKGVQLLGRNSPVLNPVSGTPIFINNPSGSVQVISFVLTIPANQIGINYDAVATVVQTGTILNCSFNGGIHGIFAKEGSFRVVGNVFVNFSGTAVVVKGVVGSTNRQLRVSSNSFAGNAGTGQPFSSAITAADGTIQVDNNLILNVRNGVLVSKCAGKVASNEFTNAQAGMDISDSPALLAERNELGTSSSFSAVFNALGFTTFGLRLIRSSGAIVRNNTFNGGNSGIIVTQQSTGVTVEANIVRNMATSPLGGGTGIVVSVGSFAEVHSNNIENNAFGLQVISASADASDNWWGAVNGPSGTGGGSGNSISAGVPFLPFLTAPNPNAGA